MAAPTDRSVPHVWFAVAAPCLALSCTILAGAMLLAWLGKEPGRALAAMFMTPLTSVRERSELTVKATLLILMALGLAIGFRAGVWNISAEGQLGSGAIAAR